MKRFRCVPFVHEVQIRTLEDSDANDTYVETIEDHDWRVQSALLCLWISTLILFHTLCSLVSMSASPYLPSATLQKVQFIFVKS